MSRLFLTGLLFFGAPGPAAAVELAPAPLLKKAPPKAPAPAEPPAPTKTLTAPAAKPKIGADRLACTPAGDLVVTGIWLEGSRLNFKWANNGACAIHAPAIPYALKIEYLGNTVTEQRVFNTGGAVAAWSARYQDTLYHLYQQPLAVSVTINPAGTVPEANSANNSYRAPWTQLKPSGGPTGAADLAIQSASFDDNCSDARFGCTGKAKITIRNYGQKEAKDFALTLKIVGIGGSWKPEGTRSAQVASLKAGQSKQLEIDWDHNLKSYLDSSAALLVTAFVDPHNAVAETNEANNWQTIKEIRRPLPDLIVTGGYMVVFERTPGHFSNHNYAMVKIKNQGPGLARDFTVKLDSPQFRYGTYTSKRHSLYPGKETEASFILDHDSKLYDLLKCCELTATVDAEEKEPETKEKNNTGKITDIRCEGKCRFRLVQPPAQQKMQ